MVCLSCGEIIEFSNPKIEEEQERSAKAHEFTIVHHNHTLFGYCTKCAASGVPHAKRSAKK
jgi:Fur family ferric uptake transcriptional regulator